MKGKDIHDGLRVRKRMGELELTMTAFAQQSGISVSAAQRLLAKPHWNSSQLAAASRLLHWNFFSLHNWQVAKVLDQKIYIQAGGTGKPRLLLLEQNIELSPAEVIRELFDHGT